MQHLSVFLSSFLVVCLQMFRGAFMVLLAVVSPIFNLGLNHCQADVNIYQVWRSSISDWNTCRYRAFFVIRLMRHLIF